MKDELVKKLRSGEIDGDTAMSQFESPSTALADIDFDLNDDALECGFSAFEIFNYLRKGQPDLVVIGARPGIGKTALACQLALNVAKHSTALVYSLEMDKSQLMKRMLSVESEKPLAKLKLPINQEVVAATRNKFREYDFRVDDTNAIPINTLVARTLDHHRRSPLALVVVDYLQIVNSPGMRSKAEEVGSVAEKLKNLAKSIQAPVLALAQMNRMFDGRIAEDPTARPIMSDIADSAGIEKWADTLLVLHKPDPNRVTAYALKNRHGTTQDFDLLYNGSLTKFFDAGIRGL